MNQSDNLPVDGDSRKVIGDLKHLVSYCQKYHRPIRFLETELMNKCNSLHGAMLIIT